MKSDIYLFIVLVVSIVVLATLIPRWIAHKRQETAGLTNGSIGEPPCFIVAVRDSKDRLVALYTDETLVIPLVNPFIVHNDRNEYSFAIAHAGAYKIAIGDCWK